MPIDPGDLPRSSRATAGGLAPARVARAAVAVLCALALVVVAACGGDDDSGASSPDPGTGEPSGGSADPAPALSVEELAAAAGDAPAVAATEGDDPPGEAERTGLPGTSETAASIIAADGSVQSCCLLVAADPPARQRGLMEVTDLAGYQGMVFVWDNDTSGGFWMQNTPTPLSIAFFAADGAHVGSYDMEPCDDSPDCEVYPSPGTYRFALEVPQGELEGLGVGQGSRLRLGGDCIEAATS